MWGEAQVTLSGQFQQRGGGRRCWLGGGKRGLHNLSRRLSLKGRRKIRLHLGRPLLVIVILFLLNGKDLNVFKS